MTHRHYGQDEREFPIVDTGAEAGRTLQRTKDELLKIKCDNHGSIYQRGHEHPAYLVAIVPPHGVLYQLKPRPCDSRTAPINLWMRSCSKDCDD